jgi:hypothetical protein
VIEPRAGGDALALTGVAGRSSSPTDVSAVGAWSCVACNRFALWLLASELAVGAINLEEVLFLSSPLSPTPATRLVLPTSLTPLLVLIDDNRELDVLFVPIDEAPAPEGTSFLLLLVAFELDVPAELATVDPELARVRLLVVDEGRGDLDLEAVEGPLRAEPLIELRAPVLCALGFRELLASAAGAVEGLRVFADWERPATASLFVIGGLVAATIGFVAAAIGGCGGAILVPLLLSLFSAATVALPVPAPTPFQTLCTIDFAELKKPKRDAFGFRSGGIHIVSSQYIRKRRGATYEQVSKALWPRPHSPCRFSSLPCSAPTSF